MFLKLLYFPLFTISGNPEQFSELDNLIKELYYKIAAGFQCCKCDHTSKQRQNMVNHVESKHVHHEGVVCPFCQKHFATRQAHRMHHSRVHSYKPGSNIWSRVLSSNIFFPYFANIDTVLAQMSWKKQLSRGWWSSVMGLGVAVSVTLWPSTKQPSQIMLSQGTSSLMGIPVSTAISSAQQKMPLSAISTSATVRNTTSCFEMFRSWFW